MLPCSCAGGECAACYGGVHVCDQIAREMQLKIFLNYLFGGSFDCLWVSNDFIDIDQDKKG